MKQQVLAVLACLTAASLANPVEVGNANNSEPHIVGGWNAVITDYPYQLSLRYDGSHICGASIINALYALTAAHCTVDGSASRFSVRAGSSYSSRGGTLYSVVWIVVHEKYDAKTSDYDFALVKVSTEFKFGAEVKKVLLPPASRVVNAGVLAHVTGFGTLYSGGPTSIQLQAVQIPVTSKSYCQTVYLGGITDRMICAGRVSGGVDSCQGDSGGPMVVADELVGVVSWGIGCALPNKPGVYSRVASVRDWVDKHSGAASVVPGVVALSLGLLVLVQRTQ